MDRTLGFQYFTYDYGVDYSFDYGASFSTSTVTTKEEAPIIGQEDVDTNLKSTSIGAKLSYVF